MLDNLWAALCMLGIVVGAVGCIVLCVLATTTPGNDNYAEWAIGAAALFAVSLIGSDA